MVGNFAASKGVWGFLGDVARPVVGFKAED